MEIKENLKTDTGIIYINDIRKGHKGQFRLIFFGEPELIYKNIKTLVPQLEVRLKKAIGIDNKKDLMDWLNKTRFGFLNRSHIVTRQDINIEINLKIIESKTNEKITKSFDDINPDEHDDGKINLSND